MTVTVATVARTTKAVALQLEGNEARLQEVGQTQAFDDRAAIEGHEVGGFAGAVVVVPDMDTLAEHRILGVDVGAEGVVVNVPLAVDGGLVAGRRGRGDIVLKLGLTNGRTANVAALPRVELQTGNGERRLGSHRAKGQHGRGGEGLGNG